MKRLQLRGKAVVYIVWANVYGWTKSLKHEVDPAKLFTHLKAYEQIKEIRLYFGEDTHEKSKAFLEEVKKNRIEKTNNCDIRSWSSWA